MLVVGADSSISWANAAADELFGYPNGGLNGVPLGNLIPDRLREGHHDHHQRFLADPTPRFMGERPHDLLALRKDGSEFVAEISLGPTGTGGDVQVLAIVRDITPRRNQQRENETIRMALDSVAEAVFLFDVDQHLIWYANSGASRQTGIDGRALVGTAFGDLSRPAGHEALDELLEPLKTSERSVVTYDATQTRVGAEDLRVEVLVQRPGTLAFGRDSFIALARDTTARRRHQQELAEQSIRAQQREAQLALADERERIARRLQDSVIQRLFAVGIRLQATGGHPDRLKDAADAAVNEIDSCIAEVRNTIFTLEER